MRAGVIVRSHDLAHDRVLTAAKEDIRLDSIPTVQAVYHATLLSLLTT